MADSKFPATFLEYETVKQWDFIVSWNDLWSMLSSLLEDGRVRIVHDCWYSKPDSTWITALSDTVKKSIMSKSSMYITRDDICRMPLSMTAVQDGNGKTLYMIDQWSGGPFIYLSAPGEYRDQKDYIIPISTLALDSTVFNPAIDDWVPVGKDAQLVYKDIVSRFRKNMTRFRLAGTAVWMGREALKGFANKQYKISFRGSIIS